MQCPKCKAIDINVSLSGNFYYCRHCKEAVRLTEIRTEDINIIRKGEQ